MVDWRGRFSRAGMGQSPPHWQCLPPGCAGVKIHETETLDAIPSEVLPLRAQQT